LICPPGPAPSSGCQPAPAPTSLAFNPDTDGTWIVYEDNRASPDGADIYLYSTVDRKSRRLALPGIQRNPSIREGVIAFESKASASAPADLFVYVIATNLLYQITDTPSVDESFSNVTVLPNGDIRVVWAANDAPDGTQNVYANTFTPHRVLAIDDVAQAEGDSGTTAFTFTVSLQPPRVSSVTVDYATADGTATAADGDYVPTSGTLTFGPGETEKTITVLVNGDTRLEGDETFAIVLSNPLHAVISPSHDVGIGTIADDDGSTAGDTIPPTTTASASPAPNANGWYRNIVTVRLDAVDDLGGSGVHRIHYAVGGGLYSVIYGSTVTFPVTAEGTSSVIYFAVDHAGNAETARTLVVRIDRVAPVLSVPSPISVPATSPAGATVDYAVTASDAGGLPSPAACSPASGSVFPVGVTTVNCRATDFAGNIGFARFAVTVRSAATQVNDLILTVNGLGIAPGIANSFNAKLRDALNAINTANVAFACTKLNDFISEVRAQTGPQPGKALTAAQAQPLIAAAQTIMAALGCP
jgi:hypothetical protein